MLDIVDFWASKGVDGFRCDMVELVLKAQDIKVTGFVTSAEDGYGLPGVTIQIKGTSNGTVTDIDGDYSIDAKTNDTLVFSYVGYKTENIAVACLP